MLSRTIPNSNHLGRSFTISEFTQRLLQALTPYRLLFVLLLAGFGGWKAYASSHSEPNTMNICTRLDYRDHSDYWVRYVIPLRKPIF